MTCLDTNLRDKALNSPATIDPAAPDLILFEKNKNKYLGELQHLSRAWFLASNGFEVYPVSLFQAILYMIIGLFGKANPCDRSEVRHTLKKLLYFGYVQQYLNEDTPYYLPERYASREEQARFREKKSPYLTEDLQKNLLQSYATIRPNSNAHLQRFFGQSLVQSNLWDTLLDLEPQNDTVLNALASHFAPLPIALSEHSTIRSNLARCFLNNGQWQTAMKIQPHCLDGQEAAIFSTCIAQKQYLAAACLFETYNGRVVFDAELRKRLAESLYDEKQKKVVERDNKHAKAKALAACDNPDIEKIIAGFEEAKHAAETVIVYAQRSDILYMDEHNNRDKGFAKSLAIGHLRAAEILLDQTSYLSDTKQLENFESIWSQLKMAQIHNEPLPTGYLEATERLFEMLLASYHRHITSIREHAPKKMLAIKLAQYLDELLCVDDKFHEHIQKNAAFFAKIYWVSGELNSYFHLDLYKTHLHLTIAYSLAPTNLLHMFSIGREHEVPHSVFRKLLLKNIAIEARKQHRSLDELERYTHQFWNNANAYSELQSWKEPAVTTLGRVKDLLFETQTLLGGGLHSSLSMFQGSAGKLKSLVHSFLESAVKRGKSDAPDEDVHQSRTTMFRL